MTKPRAQRKTETGRTERWCVKHKGWVSIREFGVDNRSPDGIRHMCKPCHNSIVRETRKRPEPKRPPTILERYRARKKLEGIKPITVQHNGVEYTLHPTVNKPLFWNRVSKGWEPAEAASTPRMTPRRPDSGFSRANDASWERNLERMKKNAP